MDAQVKQTWITALRSKRYRQAKGHLREEIGNKRFGYCCLGVLCHSMGAKWKNGVPILEGKFLEHPEEAFLSPETLKQVGMEDWQQRILAEMNDDQRARFPEIADYIEKNL